MISFESLESKNRVFIYYIKHLYKAFLVYKKKYEDLPSEDKINYKLEEYIYDNSEFENFFKDKNKDVLDVYKVLAKNLEKYQQIILKFQKEKINYVLETEKQKRDFENINNFILQNFKFKQKKLLFKKASYNKILNYYKYIGAIAKEKDEKIKEKVKEKPKKTKQVKKDKHTSTNKEHTVIPKVVPKKQEEIDKNIATIKLSFDQDKYKVDAILNSEDETVTTNRYIIDVVLAILTGVSLEEVSEKVDEIKKIPNFNGKQELETIFNFLINHEDIEEHIETLKSTLIKKKAAFFTHSIKF